MQGEFGVVLEAGKVNSVMGVVESEILSISGSGFEADLGRDTRVVKDGYIVLEPSIRMNDKTLVLVLHKEHVAKEPMVQFYGGHFLR